MRPAAPPYERTVITPCLPWSTPFGTLLRRMMLWVLRMLVCVTVCFASARWGAAVEARRAAAFEPRMEPGCVIQDHGGLWIRCPPSSTWYSYSGDQGWHVTQPRTP